MRPVTTYCRWKNALTACWEIPFGLACAAIALGLVPYFVAVEVVGRQHGSWALLVIGLIPLLFGWLALKDGVYSARAALDKDGWLKAGPEAISFRLPPGGERTILWRDVVKWYEHVTRVNGVPTARKIVIEARTGTFHLPGSYFSEPVPLIVGNIADARAARI